MSLKGQNPSAVYLTGYIQPPVEPVDSDLMNPMYEDMELSILNLIFIFILYYHIQR